jgi:hypothetical protein
MSARTIDVLSDPAFPSGSAERSGTTVGAVVVAAILAFTLGLLTGAYATFGPGPDDGYPDVTQQWTD